MSVSTTTLPVFGVRFRRLAAGALALVFCLPIAAFAQDAEEGGTDSPEPTQSRTPGIEEFIVTSSGQQSALQDTAVSVTSFDQEYLEALGAQTIADVAQFTPNLEIRSPYANTNPTLFIRGVGLRDFNANSSSSVAVFNDDIYLNSPVGQLSQLFDVEDVNVLRGPQGVLLGRNASAGAISIVSRRPTGTFGGYARATFGRFEQTETEGALEVPILEDILSIRTSGVWNRRDGFVDNRCGDGFYATPDADPISFRSQVHFFCFNGGNRPNGAIGTTTPRGFGGQGWIQGVPGFVPDKVNDTNNWAARTIMRFQPTREHDWSLKLAYSQNRAQARQLQHVAVGNVESDQQNGGTDVNRYRDLDNTLCPTGRCLGDLGTTFGSISIDGPERGDPFAGDYNNVGVDRVERTGATLSGDVYLGNIQLKTVTGVDWNKRKSEQDIDGSPTLGLESVLRNTAWQVYEDLRIAWDQGGSTSFQLGGSFLYEKLDVDNLFRLGAINTFTRQRYTQKTLYWSAFGWGKWDISEEFSFSGGFRWNFDSRNFTSENQISDPFNPPIVTSFSGSDTDFTEQDWAGELLLEYKPYEDVTFYGKYSRGWKGPHINGLVLNQDDLESGISPVEPVNPEIVNVLEAGFKTQWFDRRATFNGAGFYYDYDDIQIFQLRNTESGIPVPTLINSNDAELYGVELELTLSPFEGWAPLQAEGIQIFGSFAWLNSQYKDFQQTRVLVQAAGSPTITEDFSGNTLINSPEFSFTGFLAWDLDLEGLGFLTPRFDWSYKDQVFFGVENSSFLSQDALWLFNIRLAWRSPSEAIEVAAFVRNLQDTVYRADAINLSRFRRTVLYAVGDPRTYGVSATVRF